VYVCGSGQDGVKQKRETERDIKPIEEYRGSQDKAIM
jgi:hypothetical protein